MKFAAKGNSFHHSCPGNADKFLQHKVDLNKDVQAMPQSRWHHMVKFHNNLRSVVFSHTCLWPNPGRALRVPECSHIATFSPSSG